MTGDLKKIASPFSTGGGGLNFETRIQASFTVLMLVGGYSPCLPQLPIQKIRLQGKHKGYQTDDLIVYAEDEQIKRKAKLLGQIKHDISLTEKNTILEEIIVAAWADFNNAALFKKGRDCIALITGPLKGTDLEFRIVLEWARSAGDASDFINMVNLSNLSSHTKRQKLSVFKKHLRTANNNTDVSDDELWQFLKTFHLLVYDLDIESGVNLAMLHSLIAQYQVESVSAIWTQLIDKVQNVNQNAGIISCENIPEEIRDAFKKPTVETMPETLTKPVTQTTVFNWNAIDHAAELAVALLIGSWDEHNSSDCKVLEYVSSEAYNIWIKKLREVLAFSNSPLNYNNGVWSFKDRLVLWQALAPRLFDDHLDRFKESAIKVLGEVDPQFELEPEDRYAAAIHDKVLQHSKTLRKGLADGLAMLGSYPDAIVNCSLDKGDSVAVLTVREVLSEANWMLWGSIKDIQPLLAEAAPGEFLTAVESAINHDESPFDKLFSQEGRGVAGTNYITGLLWALEGLAWHSDYLTRVVVLLGELETHDPGGNYSNRPVNSLIDIFLPWLPHTTAPFEKRKVAMEALIRELPETAWKVLIQLLPKQSGVTSGTHKPQWRKFIPDDWKKEVTNKDYWMQVECYSDFFLNLAGKDNSRLSEFVQQIDHLPITTFDKAIKLLEHASSGDTDSNEIYQLWNALTGVVTKHKKFSDAKWALPAAEIQQLENLSEKLQPKKPERLYQRLFSQNDSGLYEKTGDWETQRKNLEKRRNSAVHEIFKLSGYGGVSGFAIIVDAPYKVGFAFGATVGDDEEPSEVKELLCVQDNKLQQFISAYIDNLYQSHGDKWLEQLNVTEWDKSTIAKLLTSLPFQMGTWQLVENLLGKEDESLYWKVVNVMPYFDKSNMYYAIDKLLAHERSLSAVECLDSLLQDKEDLEIRCAVKVLLETGSTSEPSRSMDSYSITEIIKHLQGRDEISDDDIFQIEWAYLPLLRRGYGNEVSPKFLEYRLASDPDFFCEVIRLIFRSEYQEEPADVSEQDKNIALNAYWLLHDWRRPPGLLNEGEFSGKNFTEWLDRVIELCDKSGHLDVALSQIGNVLLHVPVDENGLWIHTSVAEALNRRNLDRLRVGYSNGVYNSRGVHWVDPTGKPEKDLADKYRQYAEGIDTKGFQRFATTLRGIAESYDREAERVISEH